ncbi:DUF6474 family protein [uncultured Corynebacterium sp.]|uniref:DUF6474 family protein n=1 Tax=uncultured Corynebacterium sp. TaxID=159447 RepID=UPI0025EBEA01|nr:DUF6474 family protein [uncultured Corynebacterium sp.]
MSFLGDYRDRRRETKLKLKAAKAKAKEDAKHEAKLKDKAYRDGVKAAEVERKADTKAAKKQRKADVKAAKKTAKAQRKLDDNAMKRAEKIRKAGFKDEKKALKAKHKHQSRMAEKILEQQRNQGLTTEKAKNVVGAARLLIPVALPLGYRAVTKLQNRNQDSAARRYGVTGDAVARHHGYGAPLRARIEGIRGSLDRLENSDVTGVSGFLKDARSRLSTLEDAIETSEHMTPDQRRRAHTSISQELDGVDSEIMAQMGLTA